jgi:purine-cytosine permease-like protein
MAIDLIFLPQVGAFLFVFAIVLGILESTNMFRKGVNTALAVVFGLFSAIYEPFVSGIQTYLPLVVIPLIILFFYILIKKTQKQFEKKDGKNEHDSLPIMVVLVSLLIVLISQWNIFKGFLPAGIDATNFAWGLGIVVVLIIFWAAYKHNPRPTPA